MGAVEKNLEWNKLCSRHVELLKKCPGLPCARIPAVIFENVKNHTVINLFPGRTDDFKLTKENYAVTLKMLLYAEEVYDAIELRKFDLFKKLLKKTEDPSKRDPFFLEIYLAGLSKGEPNIIPGDYVIVEENGVCEKCKIFDIEGDRVIFKRFPEKKRGGKGLLDAENIESRAFNVSFVQTGSAYFNYHKSLETIFGSFLLKDALFEPAEDQSDATTHSLKNDRIDVEKTASEALIGRLSCLNDRQRQAVLGILRARCRPRPYILFGPPGTGKTTTVVEAIVQVYCRDTRALILVCANSNNCADQLAQLINESKLVTQMKRLVSRNHYKEKPVIYDYDVLSKTDLQGARVVVTTNNKAFSLIGLMKFDYVFIDEAGHAHEPESLIPILNLNYNGCLVLAGDPKQLGPVVKSREVERLGLGDSTLERLFGFKIYSRNEASGQYDENFITKLILSYRCDARILEICSKLFYDAELNCLGRCPDELLQSLNLAHPLVFHGIKGREGRTDLSTSRFNDAEASLCVEYVMLLLDKGVKPEKIGVITNYSLQKERIREKLTKRLKASKELHDLMGCLCLNDAGDKMDCTPSNGEVLRPTNCRAMCQVDTIDAFQGQEKEIIIISTVRTPIELKDNKDSNLITDSRFLTDAKRFNVSISRAKWLAIVVGHPAVMKSHENWAQFSLLAQFSPLTFPSVSH